MAGIGISTCILLVALAFWLESPQRPKQAPPETIGTAVRAASVEHGRAATEPPAKQPPPPVDGAPFAPTPATLAIAPPIAAAAKVAAPRDRAKDWSYGYASIVSNDVGDFIPFRFFSESIWRESEAYPGPTLGSACLNAQGGHPAFPHHAIIRRWAAPLPGVVSVKGTLTHGADYAPSDGIRGRVIAGRGGTKGEWRVRADAAVTEIAIFRVAASESVDFVVDCLAHDAGDTFEWPVTLTLRANDGAVVDTWDSAADFTGGENNALPAHDEAIASGPPVRANDTSSSLDTPAAAAANKLLAQAVALYRAEGDANDSAGNHHGKLQGDAAITPIKVGHAFKFGGDGVVVACANDDQRATGR